MSKAGYLLAGLAVFAAAPASAHITLENREATIGGEYKAVFAVPHGCAGSATIKIRVRIPEGVTAVKPVPKAGWNVEEITSTQSEGVKEVVWSGGRLASDKHDEFVIGTFLAASLKPNTTLYFPVVQECEQGISRWIEIPVEGDEHAHGHDSKSPAPGVHLMPKP